jgi:hypothetical protein
MKRQKGLSLTGMIIVCTLLFLLMILAFKVVPVYLEFFTVEKHFKAMAMDPKLRSGNRQAVAAAWSARAAVDNLNSVQPDLIEVTKEADGIVVSAEYAVKVPLFRNVAACFDFTPSSR